MQTRVQESDGELITAVRTGDAGAFERLFTAHAPPVRVYLLRCGFSPADADDHLQEVFLNIHRSVDTYDPDKGALRTWIGSIARNVARRHWAKRPRWDVFDPELAEAVFPDPDNPRDRAAAHEEFLAVRDCVQHLPPELQRLVRLRYEDGRTTRNIANATGMPESTVRVRLSEARDLLERCLKGKGVLE